jgi:Uma2 family endonuclease
MASITSSFIDFDSLVLRNVDWATYCKLRDEPSHHRFRMTYLDGTLTITSSLFDQGFLTLQHVDWEIYRRLRDEPTNDRLRMTYLDGTLILMSPQILHDSDSRRLLYVVTAVVRAWRIRFLAVGTTTLRLEGRVDLQGAAKEPDEGFYLGEDEARIRGKTTLDLSVDPPPTLAIEIDNLADSEAALPAYARLGVSEVWLYKARDRSLWFGRLAGEAYEEIRRSAVLPRLTPLLVLEALEAAHTGDLDELDWLDWLDAWARARALPDEETRP